MSLNIYTNLHSKPDPFASQICVLLTAVNLPVCKGAKAFPGPQQMFPMHEQEWYGNIWHLQKSSGLSLSLFQMLPHLKDLPWQPHTKLLPLMSFTFCLLFLCFFFFTLLLPLNIYIYIYMHMCVYVIYMYMYIYLYMYRCLCAYYPHKASLVYTLIHL